MIGTNCSAHSGSLRIEQSVRCHDAQQPIAEEAPGGGSGHHLWILSQPATHLEIAGLDHLTQRAVVDEMFTDQLIHLRGQFRY